jgi:trehalose-6-phosphatase
MTDQLKVQDFKDAVKVQMNIALQKGEAVKYFRQLYQH